MAAEMVIRAEMLDRTKKSFGDINRRLKDTDKTADKAADEMARLGNLNTKRSQRALGDLNTKAEETRRKLGDINQQKFGGLTSSLDSIKGRMLGIGAVVTGVVGGFLALANSLAQNELDLHRWSRVTGLAADSVEALHERVQILGADGDVIFESLITVTEKAKLAMIQGTTATQDFAREFGFLPTAFLEAGGAAGTAEDKIDFLAQALTRSDDPLTNAAIAAGLLGDEAAKLLPIFSQLGDEGVAGLVATERAAGTLTSQENRDRLADFALAWDAFKRQVTETGQAILVSLLPPVTNLLQTLSDPDTLRSLEPYIDFFVELGRLAYDIAKAPVNATIGFFDSLFGEGTFGDIIDEAFSEENFERMTRGIKRVRDAIDYLANPFRGSTDLRDLVLALTRNLGTSLIDIADGFTQGLLDFFGNFIATPFVQFFVDIFNSAKDLYISFLDFLLDPTRETVRLIKEAFNGIKDAVVSVWESINIDSDLLLAGLILIVGGAVAAIVAAFVGIKVLIIAAVTAIVLGIVALFVEMWKDIVPDSVTQFLIKPYKEMYEGAKWAVGQVKTLFSGLLDFFRKDEHEDSVNKPFYSAIPGAEFVVDEVQGVFQRLWDTFKRDPDQPLATPFLNAKKAASEAADSAKSAWGDAFDDLGRRSFEFYEAAIKDIDGVAYTAEQKMLEAMDSIALAAGSNMKTIGDAASTAEGHIDDLRLKAQQSIDADPFAALNAAMGTVSTNAATAQAEIIATGAAVRIAQNIATSGDIPDFNFIGQTITNARNAINSLRIGGVQEWVKLILSGTQVSPSTVRQVSGPSGSPSTGTGTPETVTTDDDEDEGETITELAGPSDHPEAGQPHPVEHLRAWVYRNYADKTRAEQEAIVRSLYLSKSRIPGVAPLGFQLTEEAGPPQHHTAKEIRDHLYSQLPLDHGYSPGAIEKQVRDLYLQNIKIPGLALGGIVTKPTLAVVGEAGPEAVIPLNKGKSMGTTININVAGSVFVEDLEQQIDFAVRRGIERYA